MIPNMKHPVYSVTLPVSNKKMKYRGFLVGEEKSLLIANENDSPVAILEKIKDLLTECSFGKFDSSVECVADAVVLFLNIRMRSVGETSEISIKCSECSEPVPALIDLQKFEFIHEALDNNISIGKDTEGNEIFMKLDYLTFSDFVDVATHSDKDEITLFKKIIKQVYDSNGKSYACDTWTDNEWNDFYSSLTTEPYIKINKFFDNSPEVRLTVNGKCRKCGHQNKEVFTDILNFT